MRGLGTLQDTLTLDHCRPPRMTTATTTPVSVRVRSHFRGENSCAIPADRRVRVPETQFISRHERNYATPANSFGDPPLPLTMMMRQDSYKHTRTQTHACALGPGLADKHGGRTCRRGQSIWRVLVVSVRHACTLHFRDAGSALSALGNGTDARVCVCIVCAVATRS